MASFPAVWLSTHDPSTDAAHRLRTLAEQALALYVGMI
jgi:hypothetical protein